MWTSVGRPRSACTTCKGQKIRCSGERPICKRCQRLRRTCIYSSNVQTLRKSPFISASSRASKPQSSPQPTSTRDSGHRASGEELLNRTDVHVAPSFAPDALKDDRYLGISKSLINTLVEVYYQNAYNASLLLHKGQFLESLAAGTANPHVVLSVCAWAANFYRDSNGHASLKDHDFMMEWAKRAGSLVFQDVENLHEENIVTFSILALFWYGQGSWRLSFLHKGIACQLLHIAGLGSAKVHTQNSLQSEIRRRRLWALYLMQCQMAEQLSLFEPVADIPNLILPWPEDDFAAGVSRAPHVCLASGGSNGAVYAELVKGMTLWSSVFSLIKFPECSISERIAGIYALDDDLSKWWWELRPDFKLTPSNLAAVPKNRLPNILLLNLIYHQSLCALHASVVPLFSWSNGDSSWSSARRSSAQVAFEHACAASELIAATLASYNRLSAMHTFVAYAAYSGCAIQIPFMWCPNPAVKERVTANIKSNMKMIHEMAPYWKFAALLEIHVGILFKIHKKHTTTLEDEPKNMTTDMEKLISFKINAAYARTSILGFIEILRSKGDGYAKPGEEANDLGIQEENIQSLPPIREILPETLADNTKIDQEESRGTELYILPRPPQSLPQNQGRPSSTLSENIQVSQNQSRQEQQPQPESSYLDAPQDDNQSLDVCLPFFDPAMLDLFPDGEMPDLSQFESMPLNLDYFDLDEWNVSSADLSGGH